MNYKEKFNFFILNLSKRRISRLFSNIKRNRCAFFAVVGTTILEYI